MKIYKQASLLVSCSCIILLGMALMANSRISIKDNPTTPPLELISAIQNVTNADGSSYNVVDNQHIRMLSAKIIPNIQEGGYIAVYWNWVGKTPNLQVRLATSTDLKHWLFRKTIEKDASQPTITLMPDASMGVVVGFEKNTEYNRNGSFESKIELQYYRSIDRLLSPRAHADKKVLLERSLSTINEGTPNIYQVLAKPDINHSFIKIGFHYNNNAGIKDSDNLPHQGVDREGVGTLINFSATQWYPQSDGDFNATFDRTKTVKGSYGARDSFSYRENPSSQEEPYTLIEGQTIKDNMNSWRPYLYDPLHYSITRLWITTKGHSKTFGTPKLTILFLPDGRLGFVVTVYLDPRGSATGEAGELIYYSAYPDNLGQQNPNQVALEMFSNNSFADIKRHSLLNGVLFLAFLLSLVVSLFIWYYRETCLPNCSLSYRLSCFFFTHYLTLSIIKSSHPIYACQQ